MGKVLGIVYRAIATHLRRKAGYTKATAQTGAVTPIQRFGGAVNLNIHFHMLFLVLCPINNYNWNIPFIPGEYTHASRSRPT
jgi:hypothetical protein